MVTILRILFSGVIAGIASMGITELTMLGILPNHVEGLFNAIYLNKELILFIIVFGMMFFSVSIPFAKRFGLQLESAINNYSMQEILMYIIGLGIGLYVASLITNAFGFQNHARMGIVFSTLIYLTLGYAGINLVHHKKEEIKGWLSKKGDNAVGGVPKILDTSVIIDGRILDIINTGFIEGKIIIPSFVLDELRHIADSSDSLKRNRGRRGLDILNELKNSKMNIIEVLDIDYPEVEEVDSKLLKLARQVQGKVVTNDFNLNKVAKLQRVNILNINDLANAIKQVVLPNEEMDVMVVKEGKEQEQGLAYLNDGTMIVVEGGKKYVGTSVKVNVATVLQTSAGRMIFAKLAKNEG